MASFLRIESDEHQFFTERISSEMERVNLEAGTTDLRVLREKQAPAALESERSMGLPLRSFFRRVNQEIFFHFFYTPFPKENKKALPRNRDFFLPTA